MSFSDNKMLNRIQGYLNALDDLNGGQREFSTVVNLFNTSSDCLLSEVKEYSKNINMESPRIVSYEKFIDQYGPDKLLKVLLFPKLCTGLYPPYEKHKIPSKVLNEYVEYSVFNLADFIDFTFIEAGVGKRVLTQDIELSLMQNDEEFFLVLTVTKKNIKMIFLFYRKLFVEEDYHILFSKLLSIFKD